VAARGNEKTAPRRPWQGYAPLPWHLSKLHPHGVQRAGQHRRPPPRRLWSPNSRLCWAVERNLAFALGCAGCIFFRTRRTAENASPCLERGRVTSTQSSGSQRRGLTPTATPTEPAAHQWWCPRGAMRLRWKFVPRPAASPRPPAGVASDDGGGGGMGGGGRARVGRTMRNRAQEINPPGLLPSPRRPSASNTSNPPPPLPTRPPALSTAPAAGPSCSGPSTGSAAPGTPARAAPRSPAPATR
jgi:hypothetical protein